MEAETLYQLIFWSLVFGIVIFSILMLLMVVFFGVSTAKMGKNKIGLVALFLFSFLTPLFVLSMQQKTQSQTKASNDLVIVATNSREVGNNTYQIRFETSEAAIGTLEIIKDGGSTSVLPAYSLQPRTQHFIEVKKSLVDDAEIFILLNGKRYPYKMEGFYN